MVLQELLMHGFDTITCSLFHGFPSLLCRGFGASLFSENPEQIDNETLEENSIQPFVLPDPDATCNDKNDNPVG